MPLHRQYRNTSKLDAMLLIEISWKFAVVIFITLGYYANRITGFFCGLWEPTNWTDSTPWRCRNLTSDHFTM